jgi:hypothetical protein
MNGMAGVWDNHQAGVSDLGVQPPVNVAELLIQPAYQQQRSPVKLIKPFPQRGLRARAHAAQAARESHWIQGCPLPAKRQTHSLRQSLLTGEQRQLLPLFGESIRAVGFDPSS